MNYADTILEPSVGVNSPASGIPSTFSSNTMVEVKIFSGKSSRYLADKIADYYGQPLGDVKLNRFSDGEMQPVINESVRGAFVFFVQSTFSPSENLMELLLMIDAAKRASAGYITAVIPYFGYARQDRKDKPRVPISAKLIAELLHVRFQLFAGYILASALGLSQ